MSNTQGLRFKVQFNSENEKKRFFYKFRHSNKKVKINVETTKKYVEKIKYYWKNKNTNQLTPIKIKSVVQSNKLDVLFYKIRTIREKRTQEKLISYLLSDTIIESYNRTRSQVSITNMLLTSSLEEYFPRTYLKRKNYNIHKLVLRNQRYGYFINKYIIKFLKLGKIKDYWINILKKYLKRRTMNKIKNWYPFDEVLYNYNILVKKFNNSISDLIKILSSKIVKMGSSNRPHPHIVYG